MEEIKELQNFKPSPIEQVLMILKRVEDPARMDGRSRRSLIAEATDILVKYHEQSKNILEKSEGLNPPTVENTIK